MRTGVIAGVLMLAGSVPVAALPTGFKARADALLTEAVAADGPGVSVSISEHGRIVYTAQRGLAYIATKRPVTAATTFRIGSITKQFAAATLLQMVAEGRVALDDPLAKYLPDYPGGQGITIRQLLNHTSGIQSYTDIPGWMVAANTAKPHSTAELIAVFRDKPVVSKPGATWAYNNSGYILVGAVIEAVAKRPWYEEVSRRMTGPLNLATIRYGKDPAAAPAMAVGYAGADAKAPLAQAIDMSVPGAAGALVATADDVTRWGHALHHDKLLPAAIHAQMVAPTKLPDGTTAPYGFGLIPGTVHGVISVGHSGGIFGFLSDTTYLPDRDVVVTVLVNSDEPKTAPGVLLRKLAAMAAGTPYPSFSPQPLDAKAVESFLGTYRIGGRDRVLKIDDGKLVYQNPDQATPLIPVGGNRYLLGDEGLNWIELKRNAAGMPQLVFFTDGVNADGAGVRTGPVPVEAATVDVPVATLDRYVGTYSAPFGKVAILRGANGGLATQIAGQPVFALRALGQTEFEVEKVRARVRFVETGGKVTGIEMLQNGRTLTAIRD